MNKLFLGLAMLFPFQVIATEDSVYTWGSWSQGIKPAAGPVHIASPAPVKTPNIKFRPNENSAFSRKFVPVPVVIQNPNPSLPPTGDPRTRGRR